MTTHTMDHWLEINGHEYKARTRYIYTKAYGGDMVDDNQTSPAEPAEIELSITRITSEEGVTAPWYYLPLTEALAAEILEAAWLHLHDELR